MKQFILLLSFFCTVFIADAQETTVPDTTIVFNKTYTNCENRWVAILPQKGSDKYVYGFIYIEPVAGFTFSFEGYFTIAANGTFVADKVLGKKNTYKYFFREDKRLLALITQDHFLELDVYPKPEWLKIYSEYVDTVAHNVAWGKHYNRENESERALIFLEKARTIQPHATGLDFEFGFAYNALKRYDEAIKVLTDAVKIYPSDFALREELGICNVNKGNVESGIVYIKEALALTRDDQVTERSEMALQIALASKTFGDYKAFSEWIMKARSWAPKNSIIYQQVAMVVNQNQ